MNLLKTLKYGGRRTDPGPAEMDQLVVFDYFIIELEETCNKLECTHEIQVL
jgi:hypothetical protein